MSSDHEMVTPDVEVQLRSSGVTPDVDGCSSDHEVVTPDVDGCSSDHECNIR